MRLALLALVLACPSVAFVACASTEDADAKDEQGTATVPEGGGAPASDAGGDGCAGEECSPALDCTMVDFCPTTFPVSRLVALNAIWGSGPNDVWAVGTRGTILHGDGTTFVPVATSAIGATDVLVAVWGASSTDVWILGPSFPFHGAGHQGDATTFEPREGSSWAPSKASTGRIWAGASVGSEVFLAGEASERFGSPSSFWRFAADANSQPIWSAMRACTDAKPCSPAVRGIWAAGESMLWAVGHDGQAFVWDGTSAGDAAPPRWLPQDTGTRDDLEAVWGSGPNDVWAVGRGGTIRHTSRGAATWTRVDSPSTTDLHAIWGSGPADVWAVGDGGTILHYDGKTWTLGTLALPNGDVPTNLFGVWGSGPEDVWIVGEGLILHRTATNRRHP